MRKLAECSVNAGGEVAYTGCTTEGDKSNKQRGLDCILPLFTL